MRSARQKSLSANSTAKDPPERAILHGRMINFVAEAHGKIAPMADALTSHIITRQAKVIEKRQGTSPSSALRHASGQVWEPLSCHCLRLDGLAWLAVHVDLTRPPVSQSGPHNPLM